MVSTTPLRGLQTADLDCDGDLDLLASIQGETAWFENNGARHSSNTSPWTRGSAFSIADMNGDGALDVVFYDRSSSSGEQSFGLAWCSLIDRQISVAAAPAAY